MYSISQFRVSLTRGPWRLMAAGAMVVGLIGSQGAVPTHAASTVLTY